MWNDKHMGLTTNSENTTNKVRQQLCISWKIVNTRKPIYIEYDTVNISGKQNKERGFGEINIHRSFFRQMKQDNTSKLCNSCLWIDGRIVDNWL